MSEKCTMTCGSSLGADTGLSVVSSDASLLLILPEIPWPLRRNGISLRFAPILDYLSRKWPIDILVLASKIEAIPVDMPRFCRSISVVQIGMETKSSVARRIETLVIGLWPWGAPYGGLPQISRHQLRDAVTQQLSAGSYAAIIWAAGFPDVVSRIRRGTPEICFITDVCDSPSLVASRAQIGDPVLRVLRGYTTWKLRRFEQSIHRVSDASIYISPADALASRPKELRRIHVIPNGVSTPETLGLSKSGQIERCTIGFLGDMSYPPNVSAVLRLAGAILPRIRSKLPAARLLIIGRNPAQEVLQLQSEFVTVTGEVGDIWEYISRVSVFCFPLVEGAGLQNKILEAMYARVPVVASSLAARGVEGVHEKHLLIADSADETASQVLRLLGDPAFAEELKGRAAEFLMSKFSWSSILPRFEAIVKEVLAMRREVSRRS